MKRAIVIGGGIVGMHVALRFASGGYEVFLLEKNEKPALETSGRNSGVLHAGIYYRKDSLKAALCVRGNVLSSEFFSKYGVAHRRTGKYIIARNRDEEKIVGDLYINACQNGAVGMERVPSRCIADAIPFIKCTDAIYSGSTCLIDVGDYISVMSGVLYRNDVHVICSCRVVSIDGTPSVETNNGMMEADVIINSAGLYADEVAALSGLTDYTIIPLKGDYYQTTSLRLDVPVYPVPHSSHGALGIHLTPTFGMEVLLGPSETVSSGKDNYMIETPAGDFEEALRGMLHEDAFKKVSIHEGHSGNRPKAYVNGKMCDDFVIKKTGSVVHLIGIESPGLTAAPAIAEYVFGMI
jgi:glycerol-3-phosphate dehydrogenase